MRLENIIAQIKNSDILEKTIGVNVVLFLLFFVLKAFFSILGSSIISLRYVALPYDFSDFLSQPWSILSYGFFHAGFIALFFNMLLLFYFGSIFLDYIAEKKFIKIYFLGILVGGFFFLSSYALLPQIYVEKGLLLGSSAGVMAIMTYVSLRFPNYRIHIRFVGDIKLLHILIFFIVFNLLQIPLGNPGGYFAHLGGLAVGFIYLVTDKRLQKRKSLSKSKRQTTRTRRRRQRIDEILDKIGVSGYESLSAEEKDFLFRNGKK